MEEETFKLIIKNFLIQQRSWMDNNSIEILNKIRLSDFQLIRFRLNYLEDIFSTVYLALVRDNRIFLIKEFEFEEKVNEFIKSFSNLKKIDIENNLKDKFHTNVEKELSNYRDFLKM